MDDLAAKIETLPPALQQEVEDFVDFLQSKYAPQKKGNMKMNCTGASPGVSENGISFLLFEASFGELTPHRLDWRGSLADLKDEYSSVELQHEVLRQWEERAGK